MNNITPKQRIQILELVKDLQTWSIDDLLNNAKKVENYVQTGQTYIIHTGYHVPHSYDYTVDHLYVPAKEETTYTYDSNNNETFTKTEGCYEKEGCECKGYDLSDVKECSQSETTAPETDEGLENEPQEPTFLESLRKYLKDTIPDPLSRIYLENIQIQDAVNALFKKKMNGIVEGILEEIDKEIGFTEDDKPEVKETLESLTDRHTQGKWIEDKAVDEFWGEDYRPKTTKVGQYLHCDDVQPRHMKHPIPTQEDIKAITSFIGQRVLPSILLDNGTKGLNFDAKKVVEELHKKVFEQEEKPNE